jgi:hypothetical protein
MAVAVTPWVPPDALDDGFVPPVGGFVPPVLLGLALDEQEALISRAPVAATAVTALRMSIVPPVEACHSSIRAE